MNITHINTLDSVGGAAKVAFRLAEEQFKHGHSSGMLVQAKISTNAPFPVYEVFEKHANEYFPLEKEGLQYYSFQMSHGLPGNAEVRKADVLHLHNIHGGYFNPFSLSLLAMIKPVVWTLHDMHSITGHCAHSLDCDKWQNKCGECPGLGIYPSIPVDRTARLLKEKKDIYSNSFFNVVTPSYWLKSKLEKSILSDHYAEVIHNGIDTNLFRPINKKEVRKKFKIPENINIVGCVAHGGIENEWKGGYYISEILKSIVLKYPDTVFLNIGASGQSSDPHIVNIPFVEDEAMLSEIYSLLDVFLFTSIAENCPLVILEALSCGVPIVTFNTGGIPELVRNGLDGYVAGYKNIAEAIKCLEVILTEKNKRIAFGSNARESALKQFDHRIIAGKYEEIYQKTIGDFIKLKEKKKLPVISLSDIPEEIKTPAFLAAYNKTAGEAESVSKIKEPGVSPKMKYPKITVVTPSFNQGEFLEECIQSILGQNYPNLEYIIMDGGSSDNSVDIIKKYERHLYYWQSKPDGGQYDAINRGFEMSSGEILCWLNSDDKLHPGSFELAARIFSSFDNINWISGRHTCWNEEGKMSFVIPQIPDISRKTYYDWALRKGIFIQQESTFWRRSLWEKAGGKLAISYKLAADFELWNRFFHFDDLYLVDALLGGFRVHMGQKTSQFMRHYIAEAEQIISGEGNITRKPELIRSDSCKIVTQQMLSKSNTNKVTEDNFSYFTYSKLDHFSYFKNSDVELYGVKKDPALCELKVYQDLLCYSFIKTNIPKGSKILEIGGGQSRVLRKLEYEYECWNVDKLEGLGDGPTSIHQGNVRLIRDYIGNFNKELPENYFDFVFSISTLEHVPENNLTFNNICRDIERVMKTGALSLHCLDVAAQDNSVWTNQFLQFIFSNVETINKYEPLDKILMDPYVYFMTEDSYNAGWKNLTGKSYKNFGKPASYNVLWKKQKKMRDSETKISVIVSSYNAEKDIRNCLSDLVAQTVFDQMEVIVVDAASPQNEGAIVKEFQKKYKNITYIRTPERIGVYPAWNMAIKKARGKYITPFSTNDRLRNNAYEILSKALDENPSVSVVYGDTHITSDESESFEEHVTDKVMKWSDYSFISLLFRNGIGPHPMWKSELHHEIGYFSEEYTALGDQDFFLRAGRKYKMLHIPEYTGLYSWHDDALSIKGKIPVIENWEIRSRHIADYAMEHNKALFQKPQVSIIIPTFDKFELLHSCIWSIILNTNYPAELIVVDNNSKDDTKDFLQFAQKVFPNLTVISNKENLGFAKANNLAAKNAKGKYLVCLNNDTIVQPGWLEALTEIAENDPEVGAVGSKLIFPDGKIQHAGVAIIDRKYSPDPRDRFIATHIYYGYDPNHPDVNVPRTYQCLTAASLLIRKNAFEKLKGYDEKFWNGYEDVDLCFRLSALGLKLVYQPKSLVIHYESQSGPERFSKVEENVKLLQSRWVGKITPDYILEKDGNAYPTGANVIREYFAPGNNKSNNITVPKRDKTETLVSIIVLTYNGLKYNKGFINAVIKNTKTQYEIIVVDNASTDGTIEYLKGIEEKQSNIKVIYNEVNLGFPKGINQALKASCGNYVLIANNDIIVTDGWLERMLEVAESDDEIGIVGPISNSVTGLQIDKNAKYKNMPEMHKYAKKLRKQNAGETLEFPRVAFLCTLIKKKVIDTIGGLDERFSPGNFEDDDFCFRSEIAGFKTVIAKDVFIHHYGSKSFKADGEKKYTDLIDINRKKFVDKWGVTVEEIWLEQKPARRKSLSYPIHRDEFIEKYERALVHFRDEEFELAEEAMKRALEIYETEGRTGLVNEYANILKLYSLSSDNFINGDAKGGRSEGVKKSKKVSAIVSVYNSEKFIRGCLDDLLGQTLYKKGELEIVLVNTGSKENEEAIILEYKSKYPGIKYISIDERETVYQAWNRGIKASSGKYITNANTDDRHRSDALEMLSGCLDKNEDIDLVYSDSYVTEHENETYESATIGGKLERPAYNPEHMLIACLMGPQPMWRKSVHEKIGYFDETFISAADYEFWCRMAFVNNSKMLHIPEFLGLYYYNRNGIEIGNRPLSEKESDLIRNKYKMILNNNKIQDDNSFFNESETKSNMENKMNNLNVASGRNSDINMAEGLIESGRLDEALDILMHLIQTDTGNIDALNDLAVVSIMAGDFDAAADFIERVIRIDPMNDVALDNMNYLSSLIEEKMGRLKSDSQQNNSEAFGKFETNTETQKPKGRYSDMIEKAESFIESEDLASARKVLETILLLEEGNLDALNDLSVVEIMERNYQTAAELLEKVILNDPRNEVATENLLFLQRELDKL